MRMQRVTYFAGGLPGTVLSIGSAIAFFYGGSARHRGDAHARHDGRVPRLSDARVRAGAWASRWARIAPPTDGGTTVMVEGDRQVVDHLAEGDLGQLLQRAIRPALLQRHTGGPLDDCARPPPDSIVSATSPPRRPSFSTPLQPKVCPMQRVSAPNSAIRPSDFTTPRRGISSARCPPPAVALHRVPTEYHLAGSRSNKTQPYVQVYGPPTAAPCPRSTMSPSASSRSTPTLRPTTLRSVTSYPPADPPAPAAASRS